jgi:hypothetical protein
MVMTLAFKEKSDKRFLDIKVMCQALSLKMCLDNHLEKQVMPLTKDLFREDSTVQLKINIKVCTGQPM